MTDISSQRKAQQDMARELLMDHRSIGTLIERARRERAEFLAALLWRAVARLKPLFLRIPDSEVMAGHRARPHQAHSLASKPGVGS